MRPITQQVKKEIKVPAQQSCRVAQLKSLLHRNQAVQQKLHSMHVRLSDRLEELNQYINTHRLKTEHPPAPQMMICLHHPKAKALRIRSKTIQEQEAIKNTSEKDCDFINKLNKETRKKQTIQLPSIPSDLRFFNSAQILLKNDSRLGIEIYKQWFEQTQKKQVKQKFLPEEEILIVQKQSIYGDNWEKICQYLEHRTFEQVYYEFHNRINPKLQSGRWSLRLSIMLIILVQHLGIKKWALISSKIGVKSELQVRQRYCNILDPSLGRNSWTPQLQRRLLDIAPDYLYCWKEIAKLQIFKDKTDNCIWRKYRNLMVARSESEIRAMMPNSDRKGLLSKILAFKNKLWQKKSSVKRAASSRTKHEDDLTLKQSIPMSSQFQGKKEQYMIQQSGPNMISNHL